MLYLSSTQVERLVRGKNYSVRHPFWIGCPFSKFIITYVWLFSTCFYYRSLKKSLYHSPIFYYKNDYSDLAVMNICKTFSLLLNYIIYIIYFVNHISRHQYILENIFLYLQYRQRYISIDNLPVFWYTFCIRRMVI